MTTARHPLRRRLAIGAAIVLAAASFGAVTAVPASAIDLSPRHPWTWTSTGDGIQVGGTYTPIVGDFAGGKGDDILWYGPGSATDSLWIATDTRGSFTKVPITINGSYVPLVGDFGGDTRDDILWYVPGIGADPLWISTAGAATFERRTVKVSGYYRPVVLDLSQELTAAMQGTSGPYPKDAILWYAPGSAPDTLWSFAADGTHGSLATPIEGSPQLLPLSWGDDSLGDLLAYTPGSGPDAIYEYDTGTLVKAPRTVTGTYQPQVLGNGYHDSVLWLGPGSATDAFWYNAGSLGVSSAPPDPITATRVLATSSDSGVGYAYDPNGPDKAFAYGHLVTSLDPDVGAGAIPVVGDFDHDLGPDVLFYVPGSGRERIGYGSGPT